MTDEKYKDYGPGNLHYDLNEKVAEFLREFGKSPSVMLVSPTTYNQMLDSVREELGFEVDGIHKHCTRGGLWMQLYESPKVEFCEVF